MQDRHKEGCVNALVSLYSDLRMVAAERDRVEWEQENIQVSLRVMDRSIPNFANAVFKVGRDKQKIAIFIFSAFD